MCDLYIVPIALFSSVRATASKCAFLEHSSCRLLGLGQIALSHHEGVISRVCYLFAPTLHSPLEGVPAEYMGCSPDASLSPGPGPEFLSLPSLGLQRICV